MTYKEFITKWNDHILNDPKIKISSYSDTVANFDDIKIPQKSLIIGESFFDTYEIITADGECIHNADDYSKAKFIVYSSREHINSVRLPKERSETERLIKEYESYLDELIKRIEKEYRKYFQDNYSKQVINDLFKKHNIVRY